MGDPAVLIPEPLDAAALATLGDAYDIGTVVRHWPVGGDRENQTFLLTARRDATEREYVLTLTGHRAIAGDSLAPFLDACAAQGLPVPAPVRLRHGVGPLTLAGMRVMLCSRLPGRAVLVPTLAQIASVGRFLARLHRDPAPDVELVPHPRTLAWLETQARGCLPHLPYVYQRDLQDALREVRGLLEASLPEVPTGPIHGNLTRDNVLFDRWGLAGVLDFQQTARGVLLYDLALAANDWCVDAEGAIDNVRFDALLDAYAGIRPFTGAELRHLPAFMLYTTLAGWLARLTVAIGSPDNLDRDGDLDAFARILTIRRERPVHLDAWRFEESQCAGRAD